MRTLTMPQLGLDSEEVLVLRWLVAPGDEFSTGTPLLEVETEKATMEVEAPFDGVLASQLCAADETVAVGAVIGYAADPGEDLEAVQAELRETAASAPSAPAPDETASADAGRTPVHAEQRLVTAEGPVTAVVVPHGELAGVASGVPATAATPAAPADATSLDDRDAAGPGELRPLNRRRAAIGRRMAAATAIPCFSVARDVSLEAAAARVEEQRNDGCPATLTDVLIAACARAAREVPRLNSWYAQDGVLEFERVNVAIAVDAPGGVIAPVLRDAGGRELPDIAALRADLIERARAATLDARELLGATITLSNVGPLGAHVLVPVLTAPQVAVLGVGAVRSGGRLATVTVVADHRAVDGADGAAFLASFAQALDGSEPPPQEA